MNYQDLKSQKQVQRCFDYLTGKTDIPARGTHEEKLGSNVIKMTSKIRYRAYQNSQKNKTDYWQEFFSACYYYLQWNLERQNRDFYVVIRLVMQRAGYRTDGGTKTVEQFRQEYDNAAAKRVGMPQVL